MADEAPTRGRADADAHGQTQFLLLHDSEDDTTAASARRVCDHCGGGADWVLADRTGVVQGFICVPCHEVHSRRRKRWHRRITRHLRHAVRRS